MVILPRYNIFISPQQYALLNRDVWAEETVRALVDFGQGRREIRLKYRGAHTRVYNKKSFYMQMDGRVWHLDADVVDPSRIRSKWSFDTFTALHVLAPRATHVTLTLNGEDLGIYTMLESVDRLFLWRRRLPPGDLFYAVDNRANFGLTFGEKRKGLKKSLTDGYELKEKVSSQAKHRLAQFIWQLNTMPEAQLTGWLQKTVEVRHYLRWLAGIVLTSNADGFIHNYALYRHPKTGKWWIIPWDYDGTWGRDCYGQQMPASEVPLFGYNRLTERILEVPAFRRYYIEFMTALLRHYFVPNRLMRRAHILMSAVREGMSRFAVEKEMEVFKTYIIRRRRFLMREIKGSPRRCR